MQNLNLTKADNVYYGAGRKPETVEFPPLPYLQFTGKGAPESADFRRATKALYTLAYGVRAICKAEGRIFTVAKLEGLWWTADGGRDPLKTPREEWQWMLLIRLPDFATEAIVEEARRAAMKKKPDVPLQAVVFGELTEGLCVQMLHVGPYSSEPETLAAMEDYMNREGLAVSGKHHEVYLSDPWKTEPGSLRTILRYPVSRVEVVQP